jgi:hypothetical protein
MCIGAKNERLQKSKRCIGLQCLEITSKPISSDLNNTMRKLAKVYALEEDVLTLECNFRQCFGDSVGFLLRSLKQALVKFFKIDGVGVSKGSFGRI